MLLIKVQQRNRNQETNVLDDLFNQAGKCLMQIHRELGNYSKFGQLEENIAIINSISILIQVYDNIEERYEKVLHEMYYCTDHEFYVRSYIFSAYDEIYNNLKTNFRKILCSLNCVNIDQFCNISNMDKVADSGTKSITKSTYDFLLGNHRSTLEEILSKYFIIVE